MREKRDISRNERTAVEEFELDSPDEIGEFSKTNKPQLGKQAKHAHSKLSKRSSRWHLDKHCHYQAKISSDSKAKEDFRHRHKRRKEKQRASCHQTFCTQDEKSYGKRSLITKNRLTRCIGIYNKGKTSDTIYREQRKSKFFSKVSNSLREKTNQDMSKVLDCSSFQIRPLHMAATESFNQDNNSGSSSYHSEHKDHFGASSERREFHSPVSVTSIASPNHHGNTDDSPSKILPLQTPLKDITQKLTNTLKPCETFGRDYLQEIRDELKAYYRKSSSMLGRDECDVVQSVSTPAHVGLTPVRIEGKTTANRKLYMSSIGKIEHMSRKSVHSRSLDDTNLREQETPLRGDEGNQDTDDVVGTRPAVVENDKVSYHHVAGGSRALSQNEQTRTVSEPLSTREQLLSMRVLDDERHKEHATFDILSILDPDLRCTDEVSLIDLQSPMFSKISPLKKPSLEIPSPPGKLLPRKLF